MHAWLKPGGTAFVGDIPDLARMWHFYSGNEYKQAFIESVEIGKPIIGTWFDVTFLMTAAQYVGFKGVQVMKQPSWMFSSLCFRPPAYNVIFNI